MSSTKSPNNNWHCGLTIIAEDSLGNFIFLGEFHSLLYWENPNPDLSNWDGNLRCWQNSAVFYTLLRGGTVQVWRRKFLPSHWRPSVNRSGLGLEQSRRGWNFPGEITKKGRGFANFFNFQLILVFFLRHFPSNQQNVFSKWRRRQENAGCYVQRN